MKTLRKITLLMLSLFFCHAVSFATGAPLGYVVAGAAALSLMVPQMNVTGLALDVNVEMWKNDVIGNLFKANPFLQYSFNADSYVIGGKIVHIPTAGAKPDVVKNRSVLPAVVKTRTDTDITYQIDEYTTNPFLIPNVDQVELSYDKRMSILSEHQDAINETIGDWAIRNWCEYTLGGVTSTADLIRTTSATLVTAHAPGATGATRKKFTKEDLKAAMKRMNLAKIPKENRYALIDSEMMDQLLDDADLKVRDRAMEADYVNGVIARLYSFNLIERADVAYFTSAGAVRDPGNEGAASDHAGVVCWQQNSVEKAEGAFQMFFQENAPEYFGDLYSMLLRFGARLRRERGVVTIVQTT